MLNLDVALSFYIAYPIETTAQLDVLLHKEMMSRLWANKHVFLL